MGQDDRTTEEKRSAAARLVTRMLHGYFAISRGMTLGVRAACYDDAGRIFLVRHSYVPGWHMPGGGVERRETALQRFRRNWGRGPPRIGRPGASLHANSHSLSRRDHVLFYRRTWCQTAPSQARMEMSKAASSLSTEPPARRDAGARSAAWGTQRGGPARHLWSARFGERLAAVRPSRSSSVRRHPQGRVIDLLLRLICALMCPC